MLLFQSNDEVNFLNRLNNNGKTRYAK